HVAHLYLIHWHLGDVFILCACRCDHVSELGTAVQEGTEFTSGSPSGEVFEHFAAQEHHHDDERRDVLAQRERGQYRYDGEDIQAHVAFEHCADHVQQCPDDHDRHKRNRDGAGR